MRGAVRFAATLALAAALPAQAATCWDARTIGAARINELGTMMMTASLRCRIAGVDFRDSLDRASRTFRQEFDAAHDRLQRHFAGSGADGGMAYGRFLTRIANLYGAGRADRGTCRALAAVNEELARPGVERDLLMLVALEMVRDPRIDGPTCAAGRR
jgi:hypothetical protein